ncbi:MAG: MBL fold metallo-hydrolase [Candidatus Krumholzibacteriota bacterium]|nr:MBL fold metallo-hydrolase [Candidatus Krumholzibacteriota bacterium]
MNLDDSIKIDELVVGPLATNCYLVSCVRTMETVIIDPGGDAGVISGRIASERLHPVKIILTHGHSDHMAAAEEISRRFEIDVFIDQKDMETMIKSIEDAPLWGLGTVRTPKAISKLTDGDKVTFGDLEGEIIETPGHTLGGISILLNGAVFVGDTLFARSIGRTDFFGGDMDTLISSIRSKLFSLPDETVVYCGHGPSTSIGIEKRQNPFLNGLI